MSRSVFGWSLPPGVTDRMIDEAAGGYDEPDPEEVCPVCGDIGNPVCYEGVVVLTDDGQEIEVEAPHWDRYDQYQEPWPAESQGDADPLPPPTDDGRQL